MFSQSPARAMNFGYGARVPHYQELIAEGPRVPWVELITENFLGRGARPAAVLERVRKDAHVALHGVSLSIGGVDPLNETYLRDLRALADHAEAAVVSDHVCFGTAHGHYAHDLWPVPFTEESLANLVARVAHVQERLGRRIALENVSSYLTFAASTLAEWEFLAELTKRADCTLLLDVNNVYVSAHNHGFDPYEFLNGLPRGCVAQFHVAGHSVRDGYHFDDHGSRVPDAVWALHAAAVARFGAAPAILEWDENVPSLPELIEESAKATRYAEVALHIHQAGDAA